MKINQSTPVVSSTVTRTPGTRTEASKETLGAKAPELQSSGLGDALAQSSDVDMDKVNQVRHAISEGKLSLDPDVLARAVMELHRS